MIPLRRKFIYNHETKSVLTRMLSANLTIMCYLKSSGYSNFLTNKYKNKINTCMPLISPPNGFIFSKNIDK